MEVNLVADDGAFTIATTALPDGAVGVPYSAALQTSGESGNVAWTLISGDLPDGLDLAQSAGIISGVPTEAGRYAFTVRAAEANGTNGNGNGRSAEAALKLYVDEARSEPIPDNGGGGGGCGAASGGLPLLFAIPILYYRKRRNDVDEEGSNCFDMDGR